MELSNRLKVVAAFVTAGYAVADIGTDHGYIPIYLAKNGSPRVLAMDINEGPLSRAADHIKSYHLESIIETRISDGMQNLNSDEVQSVVLAGMGGALVIRILSDWPEVTAAIEEFVLQPQSELVKVREYLQINNFIVQEEEMVLEEGKFYPVMHIKHGYEAPYTPMELRYGRRLLKAKHPLLHQYITREIEQKEQILSQLAKLQSEAAAERRRDIEAELICSREALERIAK